MLADRGLDRILVDIPDDREKLVGVVDGPALEAGLKKAADALVFLVVPVNKAGNDVLEDPAQGHLAGFDDQVDVVGHQAVGVELKAANGLILPKDRQEFPVIVGIGENLLLVDAAVDHVIDIERTFFALGC